MSFQQTINRDIPRAVAGDFASTNPRFAILAGESALRTAEPITVGRFAYADVDTGLVYANYAAGRVIGFVHRNNQAVANPGQSASMIVPAGKETALFFKGDFYTVFTTDVVAGEPVNAKEAGGEPVIATLDAQATLFKIGYSATAGELVKITVDAI